MKESIETGTADAEEPLERPCAAPPNRDTVENEERTTGVSPAWNARVPVCRLVAL